MTLATLLALGASVVSVVPSTAHIDPQPTELVVFDDCGFCYDFQDEWGLWAHEFGDFGAWVDCDLLGCHPNDYPTTCVQNHGACGTARAELEQDIRDLFRHGTVAEFNALLARAESHIRWTSDRHTLQVLDCDGESIRSWFAVPQRFLTTAD